MRLRSGPTKGRLLPSRCRVLKTWNFTATKNKPNFSPRRLEKLEHMGGQRRVIDFRSCQEVASLLYDGPWLAERLAGLDGFLRAHADECHPVTRGILQRGTRFTGVDVFKAQARLDALRDGL